MDRGHNTAVSRGLESVWVSEEDVALLWDMCSIYSPSGEEGQMADFLVEKMASLGWQACKDEIGNAVGQVGGGSRHLLFLGHIDTVVGRIPVRIKGDTLWGRGSVDAKGPLAAFISAVTRVTDLKDLRITVIGAVGEEKDSRGARHIVSRYAPDYCIIGEPSGWAGITLGYKGSLRLKVEISKEISHTARGEASAPEEAFHFWQGVQEVCASLSRGEGVFATLTPFLAGFQSGEDGFCHWASLDIGLRLPLGCPREEIFAGISALNPAARIQFSDYQPAFKAGKANPLVASFLAAIRAEQGRPTFKRKTGTADMNIVGPAWGCPILAYGPGDSSLDHTPRERLSLREYGKSIAVLTRVLEKL